MMDSNPVTSPISLPGIYEDVRLGPSPTTPTSTSLEPPKNGRWALRRLGDDTIRALRYCLSFLRYAIDNVALQLSIVRQAIVDKMTNNSQ